MKKKHLTLLLFFGVFALPIILAKLILDLNWYQGGVTNRGQLLSSPITASWLQPTGKWQLVYLLPERCDEACQGALFTLGQLPAAVGAELKRVESLVLVSEAEQLMDTQLEPLTGSVKARLVSAHVLRQMDTLEFGLAAIYLADPHGNIMLAYPLVTGQEAVLSQGKDVLRDLKRLLKVSRIG